MKNAVLWLVAGDVISFVSDEPEHRVDGSESEADFFLLPEYDVIQSIDTDQDVDRSTVEVVSQPV